VTGTITQTQPAVHNTVPVPQAQIVLAPPPPAPESKQGTSRSAANLRQRLAALLKKKKH
jgi:hypothetical protein